MEDKLYVIERKLLYKELEPLFMALAPVRYAIVKGEALSKQIYGVPDKRRSNDVDILIDKQNVKLLEELLHDLGFEQKLPEDSTQLRRNRVLCMACSHQIPSYHKEKFRFHFNVDVNHDIFWGQYEGQRCSIDEFLGDTVEMEIYGVNVKTLPIEKAFVQLVLHHYKEMNSLYNLSLYNAIRTDLFRDILDMILFGHKGITAEKIRVLGDEYKIQEVIYYILYYTYCVFQDEKLLSYVNALKDFENKNIMNHYGLCSKERKQWRISFENRLNNDNIWDLMCDDILDVDIQNVMLEKTIFT